MYLPWYASRYQKQLAIVAAQTVSFCIGYQVETVGRNQYYDLFINPVAAFIAFRHFNRNAGVRNRSISYKVTTRQLT